MSIINNNYYTYMYIFVKLWKYRMTIWTILSFEAPKYFFYSRAFYILHRR